MCLGIPMQVIAVEPGGRWVVAEGRGQRARLDCVLVGEPAPGAWLLGFAGAARELLDAERAAAIDAALDAVEATLAGGEVDFAACFPDLAGRTPQLPEHLRKNAA